MVSRSSQKTNKGSGTLFSKHSKAYGAKRDFNDTAKRLMNARQQLDTDILVNLKLAIVPLSHE
jgi:hypothetical protein